MKLTTTLLAASLAANLGFATLVLVFRSPQPDTAGNERGVPGPSAVDAGGPESADGVAPAGPEAGPAPRPGTAPHAALWPSLQDDDPVVFEKKLREAGLPDHIVSALLAADARERTRLRRQGNERDGGEHSDTSERPALAGTERVVGLPGLFSGPLSPTLDFIDPSRRAQAQAIARDYDAMIRDLRRGGTMLTESEKQMLATLEAERHRDLEGILTPGEIADFEMLKSPLYARLAYETSEFKPTLEEFRAIYASAKEYADRFGVTTPGSMPPRREDWEAARQFRAQADDQLLLLLGTDRYAEYDRSRNFEYRELAKLTRRLNLPATQAVEVFSMRDYVSAESNRIVADKALAPEQKLAALQTLTAGVRREIQQRLGNEGSSAYMRYADRWLAQVESGASVTFEPSRTVFRRVPGLPSTARPPAPPPGG